jgi:murein DD-endopeptidase MepM/ murein hydrolase activator NlpD
MKGAALLLAAALLPLSLPAHAAPEHVVREGETLNGIANRNGVTGKALAEANGLKAPFALRLGQKLTLPRANPEEATKKTKLAAKPARATQKSPGATQSPGKAGAARPADRSAPVEESVHLVTEGETLGGIASRAKVPRVLIAEANGIAAPYDVRPGQKLLIPRTRHYVVKAGDTGFAIAYRYGVPWSQIAVANGLDAAAPVTAGKQLLIPTMLEPQGTSPASKAADATAVKTAATANAVATAAVAAAKAPAGKAPPRLTWPLSGAIRRGWRASAGEDHHDGLDITAPRGAAVRAAAAGTVIFAGEEKDQFGNLVVLDHGDGWNTAYAFLSKITVTKGSRVRSGERIGLVGNTGKARGDELHFEVRQGGLPIDPMVALPKSP